MSLYGCFVLQFRSQNICTRKITLLSFYLIQRKVWVKGKGVGTDYRQTGGAALASSGGCSAWGRLSVSGAWCLVPAAEDKISGLFLSSFSILQRKFPGEFRMAASKPQRDPGTKLSAATIYTHNIKCCLSVSHSLPTLWTTNQHTVKNNYGSAEQCCSRNSRTILVLSHDQHMGLRLAFLVDFSLLIRKIRSEYKVFKWFFLGRCLQGQMTYCIIMKTRVWTPKAWHL